MGKNSRMGRIFVIINNMNNLSLLLKELKRKANPEKAKLLMRFFKTGKGQYGEGDIFLGIMVPESRELVKKYCELSFPDLEKLIKNKYHEARLIALLILVDKYKKCDLPRPSLGEVEKKKIFDFYLAHTPYINNWDLVDLSAGYIVGDYLWNHPSGPTKVGPLLLRQEEKKTKQVLEKLAKSKNLWERRIAIISTFAFIYKGESKWTFHIVKMLLNDPQDLIHKACGWMLREVGKRVRDRELMAFLDVYGPQMPRTMLRYAIERLPEKTRLKYLNCTKK